MMYNYFILFFSIHVYCSNANISRSIRDERSPTNNKDAYMKRITISTESDIKVRPYMVQILSRSIYNMNGNWITTCCSGTIVAKQWILTSAQCRGDNFEVYVGSANTDYVLQTTYHDVAKRFRHPRHFKLWFETIGDTTHFDIMLLKLTYELTYTSQVSEIALARDGDVGVNKRGVLVGFEDHRNGAVLKEFPLKISRRGRCKSIEEISWYKKDERDAFCGGIEGDIVEGRFPCSSSFTGGAFVSDKRLVGVMTLGEDCSRSAPTFTNVFFFKDWIYATIRDNSDKE